jgi:PBP1b-binding outer membrane lipoprotein LpoB
MNAQSVIGVFLVLLLLLVTAGCTQTTPPATQTPTVVETIVSEVPTALPTSFSLTPGPTQTLPENWNIEVQVEGNGEAIDPQIITTIRGGKGVNFILAVDVRVTRADGKVETASIPRKTTYKVGDSVSLPVTPQMGNVNRVEVWATDPQGNQVKIFDDYVPFRTYN